MRFTKDPYLKGALASLFAFSSTSAWMTVPRCPTSVNQYSWPTAHVLCRVRPSTYLNDGEPPSWNNKGPRPEKGPSRQPVQRPMPSYDLGIGKNPPVTNENGPKDSTNSSSTQLYWNAADIVEEPESSAQIAERPEERPTSSKDGAAAAAAAATSAGDIPRVKKMVPKTEGDASLRGAIWHEEHFGDNNNEMEDAKQGPLEDALSPPSNTDSSRADYEGRDYETLAPHVPKLFYPDIDLSIPEEIFSDGYDAVWDLMRWEAFQEAKREPLLVSFLYSSILNHKCLESSLAFLLANRLSSPAMISTQIQSLILEAFESDKTIGRKLRADIMAVRDRDPACTCLPDVFLYFKGFHALQAYRVANVLWKTGRSVLAHYLQSQMSQTFQIDIHPNATLGSGIMLDHGTGIVVGETAKIGHNCSILHHVTLGGSGKKGVDRHPKVGDGVLLGAGASVVGNVQIGDGCQVGAGTLVITDLPAHSVAVGVPAKIIGSFVDVSEQPSIGMNQMMDKKIVTFQSAGI